MNVEQWDALLYVFGPNSYVLQYAVYYTCYVYIYFYTFTYEYQFAR